MISHKFKNFVGICHKIYTLPKTEKKRSCEKGGGKKGGGGEEKKDLMYFKQIFYLCILFKKKFEKKFSEI
jgi:hypothetical protein